MSIFLSLISESETHMLYRFITHRVKYFKLLFIEIFILMAYRHRRSFTFLPGGAPTGRP